MDLLSPSCFFYDHQMAFLLALLLPLNVLVWASFQASNVVPGCFSAFNMNMFVPGSGCEWTSIHLVAILVMERLL
jgi:hypothetical protein